jgi:hypothetical protein
LRKRGNAEIAVLASGSSHFESEKQKVSHAKKKKNISQQIKAKEVRRNCTWAVTYPGIFLEGVITPAIFFGGGVQQIQLRAEKRGVWGP